MTSNLNLRRLRWLMSSVQVANAALDVAGQPAAYWHDPSKADERFAIGRWFMHLGSWPFFAYLLVVVVGAFALVTYLPRCAASIVLLTFLLLNFQGTCSWMMGRFDVDFFAAILLAVAIAWLFVHLSAPESESGPSSRP